MIVSDSHRQRGFHMLPNFLKQNNVVTNIDYNQSTKTTHRLRFNMTNIVSRRYDGQSARVLRSTFPASSVCSRIRCSIPSRRTCRTRLRIAYRRSEANTPVGPNILFPGLDVFPNIGLADIGLNIGPNPNAPQTGIENNYQIVDNVTYLWGNHSLKFGGDFRKSSRRSASSSASAAITSTATTAATSSAT